MNRKLRVAVLGGGPSAEHEVSLRSAASIAAGLRAAGHDVLEIVIDQERRWWSDGRPLEFLPGQGMAGVDLAFPALHGPYGEDGTVQGLLEGLGIPYVGSTVGPSALCMDKVLFKDLLSSWGIPQVRYLPILGREAEAAAEGDPTVLRRLLSLGLPLFVKPARCGSSLGIVKVEEAGQLCEAVATALRYDTKLIVEEGVTARELECGLLEEGEGFLCTPPGEVEVGDGWYDFAAKYSPGGIALTVPAPVPDEIKERCRRLAVEVARRLGIGHLARVDFFLCGERLLLNELNTMPGFTETSVYPKLLGAAGLPYPELLERLCALALARANSSAASPAR